MSHTRGPWSVPHFATAKDENDCICTYVLSDTMFGAVCSVHIDNGKAVGDGGNDCPPLEEAKANARLIAAAPDLLAALKEIVRGDVGATYSGSQCVEIAEAAISKAEGK